MRAPTPTPAGTATIPPATTRRLLLRFLPLAGTAATAAAAAAIVVKAVPLRDVIGRIRRELVGRQAHHAALRGRVHDPPKPPQVLAQKQPAPATGPRYPQGVEREAHVHEVEARLLHARAVAPAGSSPPPAADARPARLAMAAEQGPKGGYFAVHAGLGAAAEAVEAPGDHVAAPGDDAEVVEARASAAVFTLLGCVIGRVFVLCPLFPPAPPPPDPPPPAEERSPVDTRKKDTHTHTHARTDTRV